MTAGPRLRLDQALVARGLVASRARARDLVLRGLVKAGGETVSKPALLVTSDMQLVVDAAANAHVSRGAAKLAAALQAFGLDPGGRRAVDIGASTGGFTQVLLERGAAHVVAVDVGRGQLHAALAADPRVTSREGTDARVLDRDVLGGAVEAIAADVSFISLTKALPAVMALASPGCWLAALVKPQFELTPAAIGKGGIVKDPGDAARALAGVADWVAARPGWTVIGTCPSPLPGKDGNQEFLLGAVHRG